MNTHIAHRSQAIHLQICWHRDPIAAKDPRGHQVSEVSCQGQESSRSFPTLHGTRSHAIRNIQFRWNPNGAFDSCTIPGVELVFINSLVPQLLACQVPSGSTTSLFSQLPWDVESVSWEEEADLRDVIEYVRGSKLLRLPDEWRAVFPSAI